MMKGHIINIVTRMKALPCSKMAILGYKWTQTGYWLNSAYK